MYLLQHWLFVLKFKSSTAFYRMRDKLSWFAARCLLPDRVAYFSAINVVAHATTGNHSNTIATELRAMEAIKRFADDKNLD